MYDRWIADRMRQIEASGIRKVFELARSLRDPVNLSIGQPDFDVPEPIKAAAQASIARGENGYTLTQGIPELREKLAADVAGRYGQRNREHFITSGTSGGLMLALCCTVNPGDEVVLFDPYFVAYPQMIALAGGRTVYVDTYPDFEIDIDRLRAALTGKTKAIILNSPANPTGIVYSRKCLRHLAQLTAERGILLVSDEIYRSFCYDVPFSSPAEFNENVLVLDGFSKTYGMTGWRLGFAHGPRFLIEQMIKLQQFSFVCAPSMVQHAGIVALDQDMSPFTAAYRKKRDRVCDGLKERFELVKPQGAFYVFPKVPWGNGTEFVAEAIRRNLLIIPGNVFSRSDTHFRLSYAADDRTIERGIDILNQMARR
jgi:aspartate aminotransferase/aminotransferase